MIKYFVNFLIIDLKVGSGRQRLEFYESHSQKLGLY